jgi:hypothetical protein
MTLIEGSTRVESKTSRIAIIDFTFQMWKNFGVKMDKNFLSERKQVYQKTVALKQINLITREVNLKFDF